MTGHSVSYDSLSLSSQCYLEIKTKRNVSWDVKDVTAWKCGGEGIDSSQILKVKKRLKQSKLNFMLRRSKCKHLIFALFCKNDVFVSLKVMSISTRRTTYTLDNAMSRASYKLSWPSMCWTMKTSECSVSGGNDRLWKKQNNTEKKH